jgi:hypothetical protein
MFENFYLPKWFNAPTEIKSYLAKLWNKSYSELYDEDYFGKNELIQEKLESDIFGLLQLFEDENNTIFHERLIYFNWSLCLACKPTIDAWCKNKYDVSKFDYVLSNLEEWNKLKKINQCFLKHQIEINKYPTSISEDVILYQNTVKIAALENVINLVSDNIYICIEGRGIVPGSEDKRAIFNWILIDVFPAAYYQKLPEFIYTYKFRLQPNWTYQKYKE